MGNSTFGFEGHQNYGSHAFDPAEYSPADTVDVPFANYLHYVEGECPDEWNCIVKVSPFGGVFSEGIAFRNSHVWDCDTTFATVNMTSICYKPEIETNCNAEGQECDWAGSIYLNGTWLYCSFGLGDIQSPEYPNSGWEPGHCCPTGQYYSNITGQCLEPDECGFGVGADCVLEENPNPELPPINYLEKEYFEQEGCVDWVEDESCCFDIFKFGEYGNWKCPIVSNS